MDWPEVGFIAVEKDAKPTHKSGTIDAPPA